jgi:hypothetical protein
MTKLTTRIVAFLALAGAMLLAQTVRAQTGAYVAPSLGVEGVRDDNLYGGGQHAAIYYTRLRPLFGIGWDGNRFDIGARYGYDNDVFGFQLPPTRTLASHLFATWGSYEATRRLTLGAEALYVDSRYGYRPFGVFDTGVDRRMRTIYANARPYFGYRLTEDTEIGGGWFSMIERQGPVETRMHEGKGTLAHELSRSNRASLELSGRELQFSDGSDERSYAALVGWEHRFTRLTALSLEAGPRFGGGRIDPEGRLSLRRADRLSSYELSAARLQTTMAGYFGAMRTTVVAARASHELFDNFVTLAIEPAYYDTRGRTYDSRVMRLDTSLRFPVTEWLSLTATYQLSRQWFFIGQEAAPIAGEVDHTLISIGVAVGSPDPIRI